MKTIVKEKWNIGGIFTDSKLIIDLNRFFKENENYDIEFNLYDSHPGLIWAGGRPHIFLPRKKVDFINQIHKLNSHGLKINLVFSNLLIEKKHLADSRCNFVLENCYNGKNAVIVGSHILAEYIRKKYPDYKIIHSPTHLNADTSYYLKYEDLYDIFVLPPELNADRDKLYSLIKTLGAERIEIIVNEVCFNDCPFRKEHYKLVNKAILNNDWDLWEDTALNWCHFKNSKRIIKKMSSGQLDSINNFELDYQEIEALLQIGFYNFKLSTRFINKHYYEFYIRKYILDRFKLHKRFYTFRNFTIKK